MHDLNYFLSKCIFGNDGFQNIFIYQPTVNKLELKKVLNMLLIKTPRGCILTPFYTAFLHSIKLYGYRIGIQFDNSALVVGQNNYATKTVNAYIVYDLHNWSKIPLNNLKLKNCFFGATNITKNSNKSKWVYIGYGIAFDGGFS